MWGSSAPIHRPARTYTHAHVYYDRTDTHMQRPHTHIVRKQLMCDCSCTESTTKYRAFESVEENSGHVGFP